MSKNQWTHKWNISIGFIFISLNKQVSFWASGPGLFFQRFMQMHRYSGSVFGSKGWKTITVTTVTPRFQLDIVLWVLSGLVHLDGAVLGRCHVCSVVTDFSPTLSHASRTELWEMMSDSMLLAKIPRLWTARHLIGLIAWENLGIGQFPACIPRSTSSNMASMQILVNNCENITLLTRCFDLSRYPATWEWKVHYLHLFATCKAIIEILRPGFWGLNAQLHINNVAQQVAKLTTQQPEIYGKQVAKLRLKFLDRALGRHM